MSSSPAIGSDGTVYVGLYAIKIASKGLAKSPWPMRGQNPQHTGKAVGEATLQQVGIIQNFDPKLGFYLINVGSDNGIIKGDELTIFRAGKAIGKIEIARAQPSMSIAISKKGFPKPPAPFKIGDKVKKLMEKAVEIGTLPIIPPNPPRKNP